MMHLDRLPNNVRGEETVLFLRRHWVQLVVLAIYACGFLATPFLLWFLLGALGATLTGSLLTPLLAVLLAAYFLFAAVMIITQFTDYYLDTWIVTTERIINIEQRGLFSRVISTLHLNQVQDVTAETNGFFHTFLTYGDVYIQTAGTRERFNFKTVDNPEDVKNTILKLAEADKRRHGDASR